MARPRFGVQARAGRTGLTSRQPGIGHRYETDRSRNAPRAAPAARPGSSAGEGDVMFELEPVGRAAALAGLGVDEGAAQAIPGDDLPPDVGGDVAGPGVRLVGTSPVGFRYLWPPPWPLPGGFGRSVGLTRGLGRGGAGAGRVGVGAGPGIAGSS